MERKIELGSYWIILFLSRTSDAFSLCAIYKNKLHNGFCYMPAEHSRKQDMIDQVAVMRKTRAWELRNTSGLKVQMG